jgi:hypothetical protein
MDLGASWIHGIEGNPLTEIASRIDARLAATSHDLQVVYGPTGEPLGQEGLSRIEQARRNIEESLRKVQQQGRDISVQAAIEEGLDWSGLSAEEQRDIDYIVSGVIEHEYAGGSKAESALWFDDLDEYTGADALLVDGYSGIVGHLARFVPLELGEVVRSVDWSGHRVEVITNQGRRSAERVIITLPLGVLKSGVVVFEPELPERKQKAIRTLGMEVLNKCILRFPRPFWPRDVDWLRHVPPRRGEWTQWLSMERVAGKPVLVAFHAAEKGRELEGWGDDQVISAAMETLRRIFGSGVPDPVGHLITRWGEDPFARGAYSFNAIGSVPTMRDDLAEALAGKLFFAGEATERHHYGTAHGAYYSGMRAAREIDPAVREVR